MFQPQPKWEVLKVLNYVVVAVFVGSFSYVILNYRRAMSQPFAGANPMTGMFFPVLIVWSMCLAYFFGFFGISFLDKDTLVPSPSNADFEQIREDFDESNPKKMDATKTKISASGFKQPVLTETVKPFSTKASDMHDTPVCTDPVPTQNVTNDADTAHGNSDHIDFSALNDQEV